MKPISFFAYISLFTFVLELVFLIFYSYFLDVLNGLCLRHEDCEESVWLAYGVIFLIVNSILILITLMDLLFRSIDDNCNPDVSDNVIKKITSTQGFYYGLDLLFKPFLFLGFWVAMLTDLSEQGMQFKVTAVIGTHAPMFFKLIMDMMIVAEKMHHSDYSCCCFKCFYIESRTEKDERIEMKEQKKRAARKGAEVEV